MNLKESCRLHNHIDTVITTLSYYFRDTNNATKIKEKHLKKKSNPDVEDEEIEVVSERTYGDKCSVVDIAYLINTMTVEKLNLSNAINKSKSNIVISVDEADKFTLDSALEHAKKCRELASSIKPLIDLKSKETKTTGKGLKFNVEGNQVTYQYEVEKVITIDFDKNNLNKLYKKLLDKADKLSTEIESEMLRDSVDFNYKYDLHDSVNEIVEKYLENK